jgi:hypothetical protein
MPGIEHHYERPLTAHHRHGRRMYRSRQANQPDERNRQEKQPEPRERASHAFSYRRLGPRASVLIR